MTNADHTDRDLRSISAAERLERSRRIPLIATCVFVLTMLAIWLMARQVSSRIVPMLEAERIEWVRSE